MLWPGHTADPGFYWYVYALHLPHGRDQPQVFYNNALKVGGNLSVAIISHTR